MKLVPGQGSCRLLALAGLDPQRFPAPAGREDRNVLQKSSVTPSATASSAARSGQSSGEMSQKPHSLALGTLLAGSGALSRSTNADRFLMKVSSTAEAGMST